MNAFFSRLWDNEPVAIVNAIRLTVLAGSVFGLQLTETQIVALMASLEAWFTLFARRQVTTNTKVLEIMTGEKK